MKTRSDKAPACAEACLCVVPCPEFDCNNSTAAPRAQSASTATKHTKRLLSPEKLIRANRQNSSNAPPKVMACCSVEGGTLHPFRIDTRSARRPK